MFINKFTIILAKKITIKRKIRIITMFRIFFNLKHRFFYKFIIKNLA